VPDPAEAAGFRFAPMLDAVIAVASDLSLPIVLRRIAESATTLVDARYGALGVLDDTGGLADFVTVGVDDATIASIGSLPEGKGILGRLIVDPRPLRLADLAAHPDSYGFPPNHPPMRSFLGVPILVRGKVFGNLYLCEKRGADEFTATDEALAIALAVVAGVSIENARLHARLQNLVVLEDRERIARDLHDKVIQRLFATGMSLQALQPRVADPGSARRLDEAIDELDLTIREIRNTIFALHAPTTGLAAELAALIAELRERLGITIDLRVEGPLELVVPSTVAEHLTPVVREAVTNVARHAQASRVDVHIDVGAEITVRVIDDGIGMPAVADRGEGLANLEHRAAAAHGTCTAVARPEGGTVLTWRAPLDT
jgi:signal transduction histidine kinase